MAKSSCASAQSAAQTTPDAAVESLLSEIAYAAYTAERHLRHSSADNPECYEYEVYMLRDVVKKMGWMADLALSRINKLSTVQEGDAATWMLSPVAAASLSQEVQS